MDYKFIEFCKVIYVVVGFTYEPRFHPPECYVAIPLDQHTQGITKKTLEIHSINIPFEYAKEITDPKTIKTIIILYGN